MWSGETVFRQTPSPPIYFCELLILCVANAAFIGASMTKKSNSFNEQDKKRLLEIAKNILIAFADGAMKSGDHVSSNRIAMFGLSLFDEFWVNYTETFVNERRKFTALAAKMLKARAAHESTIDNFCLNAGKEYVKQIATSADGQQVSIERAAQHLVDEVLSEAGKEYIHILPNFLILHEVADIIALGRVRSMRTELAKDNTMLSRHPKIKLEVMPGLDQQWGDEERVLHMPQSVWVVEVPATKENVDEEAKWLIDVALSLMRLSASKWAHMRPDAGEQEPHPTLPPQFTIPTVMIEGDWVLAGGVEWPKIYRVNHEVVAELAASSTQSRAATLFDAIDGTLAKQVARGLGWMSRGRRATDRAEKLLFFFTALEALMSSGDKDSPITQTISRYASVIYTPDVKMRVEVFKRIKSLYGMRSATVHSGMREVLGDDVRDLQFIIENVFWSVLNYCDLKMVHKKFIESLADASHGLRWEFAGVTDD